jgi:arabinofuranosyltransferase
VANSQQPSGSPVWNALRRSLPLAFRPIVPAAAVLAGAGSILASLYPGWLGLGIGGFGVRQAAGCLVGSLVLIVGLATGLADPAQANLTAQPAVSTPRWRWLLTGIWVILAGILAVQAVRLVVIPLSGQVLDDSFITYRFARNLVDGYGLRWNPTDALPLEGFTSLTHVLLSAMFIWVGWNPVTATQTASFVSLVVVAGLLAIQARRSQVWPLGFLIAAALLFGNPFVFFTAVNGMDTALAMLAIAVATLLFCIVESNPRYLLGFCLATLACSLTRPDTVLFLAALWLYLAIQNRRRWQFWAAVAGGVLLPLIAYAAFKLWYFGTLLPTSFYFKSRLGEFTPQLPLVATFAFRFVLPAALVTIGAWISGRARFVHVWIVLAAAGAIAYYITVRPAVAIGYRFLIPFYPAILMALVWPAGQLAQLLPAPDQTLFRKALAASGLAVLIFATLPSPRQFAQDAASLVSPAIDMDKQIGRAFIGLPNPQAIVLATGEAGAIPYYSDMFHIDPYGLVTKDPRSNPFQPDMIFEHHPDLFVTHTIDASAGPDGRVTIDPDQIGWFLQNPDVSTPKFSYAIISDPRFAEYELVAKLPNGNQPAATGYHYIFVRRDSAYAPELKQRAQQLLASLAGH